MENQIYFLFIERKKKTIYKMTVCWRLRYVLIVSKGDYNW